MKRLLYITTKMAVTMSKICFFILLSLIFFLNVSSTQTIYSDNFDSYALGQVPLGWSEIHSGDGQCRVSSTQSFSASNSFRLGCLPNWDGRYIHDITLPRQNFLIWTFRFMGDPNTWFRPYFHFNVNGRTYSGGYNSNDSHIHWSDGNGHDRMGSPIQSGIWYKVTIEVNTRTGLTNYYLDDRLDAGRCNGSSPPTNTPNDGISIASGNGGHGVIYYDDIKITAKDDIQTYNDPYNRRRHHK